MPSGTRLEWFAVNAHPRCWINLVEILSCLFDGVRQVVDFGFLGLEVEVFEENSLTSVCTVLCDTPESVEGCLFALWNVA